MSDLQAVAATAPTSLYETISARLPKLPPTDQLIAAAQTGAVLGPQTAPFLPALGLAATLPGEDLEGFAVATAVLLADRLQDGIGEDDLYWHYDAHRATYGQLNADLRSALLTGFALLHDQGRVALDAPPSVEERVARPGGLVRAALTAAPEMPAQIMKQALDGGPLDSSEALWRRDPMRMTDTPGLAAAARHLYLTRPEWDPYRDYSERQIAEEGVALPFPCPLPMPHGTP